MQAAGTVRYVATDGINSGDCSSIASRCGTIQRAIDQALSTDEIWVAEGTYVDPEGTVAEMSKTVSLLGGWNSSFTQRNPLLYQTTMNGQGIGRVVHIHAGSPTVDGFIITGGNASNETSYPGNGGGIFVSEATPTIANNVIRYNIAYTGTAVAGRGGGVMLQSSGASVITANQVISNVAILPITGTVHRGYGGGIDVSDSPSTRIENNFILSNTASVTGTAARGGGISLEDSSNSVVVGNVLEYNVGQLGPGLINGGRGGGIYVFASPDVTISGNVVRHNTAGVAFNGLGGGIAASGSEGLVISGNLLQGNVASRSPVDGSGFGGGIGIYYSDNTSIHGNTVVSNTADLSPWGRGGGLYLGMNTNFTMTNNIVANNHASRDGGGMAFEAGPPPQFEVNGIVANNTFAANDRGSGNGRIAIYLNDIHVNLVLTNNIICSHTYGIRADSLTTATLNTNLFYANSSGDTTGVGSIINTDPMTGQNPLLDGAFHLRASSPAIDTGLTIPWITTDIEGQSRPIDTLYDIGADERAKFVYLPVALRSY